MIGIILLTSEFQYVQLRRSGHWTKEYVKRLSARQYNFWAKWILVFFLDFTNNINVSCLLIIGQNSPLLLIKVTKNTEYFQPIIYSCGPVRWMLMSFEWSFASRVTEIGLYFANFVASRLYLSSYQLPVWIQSHNLSSRAQRLLEQTCEYRCCPDPGYKEKINITLKIEILENNHFRDSRVTCFRLPPCPSLIWSSIVFSALKWREKMWRTFRLLWKSSRAD